MKLWIDDERPAPDNTWTVAKSSDEAMRLLRAVYGGLVGAPGYVWTSDLEEVSFDHDLGGEDTTRGIMLWMAEYGLWPERVVVHSANVVGREYLIGVAKQYGPPGMSIRVG